MSPFKKRITNHDKFAGFSKKKYPDSCQMLWLEIRLIKAYVTHARPYGIRRPV